MQTRRPLKGSAHHNELESRPQTSTVPPSPSLTSSLLDRSTNRGGRGGTRTQKEPGKRETASIERQDPRACPLIASLLQRAEQATALARILREKANSFLAVSSDLSHLNKSAAGPIANEALAQASRLAFDSPLPSFSAGPLKTGEHTVTSLDVLLANCPFVYLLGNSEIFLHFSSPLVIKKN